MIRSPDRSLDRFTCSRAAVMVVEDDYFIRAMIADELRSSGFQVVECSTADEAMDVLNAGADVSIVFSDIRMPGSMDGATLALVLSERFPALTVVLTSSEPPNGFVANQFVPKPYDPVRVIQLIDGLLGTSRLPHR
ncbi:MULTISPECIES: response regulator [unclassified Bradyrhizobium]|uniref:response regulator n=1 Tax=unclassified Bradyrhizobium TaxID=2631580 RepID=UPI00247A74F7|nr:MULTISPECIES: response regulator [unclassified Bradyrhizobium]WGR71698.1 response regulator [Bradyrhizobium sp. ISRA426]WGR76533.1 response regulator [Bradyrhizobium sp. ISRA430]WGR86938.1 response regulator [Bradyrhizobium sp. ISRA432]